MLPIGSGWDGFALRGGGDADLSEQSLGRLGRRRLRRSDLRDSLLPGDQSESMFVSVCLFGLCLGERRVHYLFVTPATCPTHELAADRAIIQEKPTVKHHKVELVLGLT